MEFIDSLSTYLYVLSKNNLMGSYNLYEAQSIDRLKRYLQEEIFKNNTYYRGQSAKFNSITCGLSRENGFIVNESAMYHETLKVRSQDFSQLKTPIEYLAKMQHYGMPTRLVDFSVNPLIALFFAIKDVEDNEDAIVYVYSGISAKHEERVIETHFQHPLDSK